MAVNVTRKRNAYQEEKKIFLEEDGILMGCEIDEVQTYCSVCDWMECPDREKESFPEEVA